MQALIGDKVQEIDFAFYQVLLNCCAFSMYRVAKWKTIFNIKSYVCRNK